MALLVPTYPIGIPWLKPLLPDGGAAPQQIQPPPVAPAIHPQIQPPATDYSIHPPVFSPPVFANSGGMAAPAAAPPVSNSYAPDVNGAILNARRNVFGADRAVLDASGRVLSAQRGTLPAQYGVLGARQGVLNAQGQQIQAERGYITQQQQENAGREQERQALLSARNNTADQTAVGQARNFRQNMDRNYSLFGVAPPTDVVNRTGELLPPGTRDALRTQEDIVGEQNQDSETARRIRLDNARLAVSMIGTNVDEAQRMASQAGLTLDQAQMLVKEAQLNEDQAQLGSRYARQTLTETEEPPFPGAERYTDPVTGQGSWLTPMEAFLKKQEIENLGTRPASEKPEKPPLSQRYSETPLGAFSDSELISGIGESFSEAQVAQELVKRGYTTEQARIKIQQGQPKQGPTTATRYSPTPLGAFSNEYLMTFIGRQNAPVSEAQVYNELLARGFTPGQASIMIAQQKLRNAPQQPSVEVPLP